MRSTFFRFFFFAAAVAGLPAADQQGTEANVFDARSPMPASPFDIPAGCVPQCKNTVTVTVMAPPPTATAGSQGGGQPGPAQTLQPVVHWDINTSATANLIPVAAGQSNKQYYAATTNVGPNIGHLYGTISYHFDSPFVHLDYTVYISSLGFVSADLVIVFTSRDAYAYAVQYWTTGTILGTQALNCGPASSPGCYFVISSISFNANTLTVTVSGRGVDINGILTNGIAEWGFFQPGIGQQGGSGSSGQNGGSGSGSGSNSNGGSGSLSGGGSGGSGNSGNNGASGNGNNNGNSGVTVAVLNANAARCRAPVDAKYGLPTACLGPYFDVDLDADLGEYNGDNSPFAAFLAALIPGVDTGNASPVPVPKPKRDLDRRFLGAIVNTIGDGISSGYNTVSDGLSSGYNTVKDVFVDTGSTVAGGVSKGVQILTEAIVDNVRYTKDFPVNVQFKLPNKSTVLAGKILQNPWGNLANIVPFGPLKALIPNANTVGPSNDPVSPWPNAVLLKSFGNPKPPVGPRTGFLDVYCVDCSAKADAQLAGRVVFTTAGFSEGSVNVNLDLDVVLKLGIEADIKFTKDFVNPLFRLNLVGLEFGVVSVGPIATVDSRVTLEAAAAGKLLAGAEMGVRRAHARLDLIDSSRSTQSGWTPWFNPEFTATGEVQIGAELGLPIGISLRVAVLTFSKSVGIFDEPSIKATAQIAGSIGASSSKGFSKALATSNGCRGISTKLSWRNRVYVDLAGFRTIDLADTGDRPITQGCIPLGNTKRSIMPASRMYRRQNSTIGAGNATISASNSTGEVVDLTDFVVSATTTIDFPEAHIASRPYQRTDGFEETRLVDRSLNFQLASCSNGDIYVEKLDALTPDSCTDLWASRTDDGVSDITTSDGGSRIIHYYANTMDKVGVSRLRLHAKNELPNTAIPVVLYPGDISQYAPGTAVGGNTTQLTANDDRIYAVLDPYGRAFYTVACTYTDNSSPRLFIAKNLDSISLLTSPDVEYSITGGPVKDCGLLPIVLGGNQPDRYEFADDVRASVPDLRFDLTNPHVGSM